MSATENTETKVATNKALATTKNSVCTTDEVTRNTLSALGGLRTNNKLTGGEGRSLRGHVLGDIDFHSIFNFDLRHHGFAFG